MLKSGNNETLSLNGISDQTYTIVALYMIIVGFLGVVLNAAAAFVLMTKIKSSSAQTHILFSLMVSDALCTAISTPFTIHANLTNSWNMGQNACAFYGFVTFSAGLSSIYHLLLLSTERFIAVVYPFRSERLLRPCNLNVSIALSWVLAIIVASMPFFGWSSYKIEGIGTSCAVDIFPNTINSISYSIFILLIGYVAPMCAIVFCNARFLKEVHRLTKNTGSSRTNAIGRRANAALIEEDKRLRKQMCFLVCTLILSFNMAWLPYAVITLFGLARGSPFDNLLICSIPSYFAKSYSVYDPVIYFILDKKFRSSLFRCLRKENRGQDRSNEVGDFQEMLDVPFVTVGEA
eukprot:gene3252-1578_t